MMSCRDQLRVAQLLLNRGKWRDVDGAPFQLISEAYIDAMLAPHFPDVSTSCNRRAAPQPLVPNGTHDAWIAALTYRHPPVCTEDAPILSTSPRP